MAAKDPWEVFAEAPQEEQDFLGRKRFRNELVNPAVRDRLIAYTQAEVGSQGSEAQQAFIESTLNRSVARNQPIERTLSGSYFPDVTHQRASRPVSEEQRAAYGPIIDRVLQGSNITNYATGNASGTVGFAGGPQTAQFGGERFGEEGPDVGWWRRTEGPGLDPWESFGNVTAAPQPSLQSPQVAPQPEADPWERFAAPTAPQTQAAPELDPWEQFGSQAKPVEEPGIVDYVTGATVKPVVAGAMQTTAAALRGLGAQQAVGQQIAGQSLSESVLSAAMKGKLPEVIQAPGTETPPLVTEQPLYQAGEAVASNAPVKPEYINQFVWDVGGGFGSVAANILPALVPVLGLPATVLFGLSQGQGEAAERAVAAGATPEQVLRASRFGSVAGATEFVDAAFPMLGGTGKTLGFLKRVGLAAAYGVFIEGGQEGLQQFIQNAIAKGIYNPAQDLTQDVAYSMLIGGIVGGAVGGGLSAASRRAEGRTPQEIAAEAAAAVRELSTPEGDKIPGPETPEAIFANSQTSESGVFYPPEGGEIRAEMTPRSEGTVWDSPLYRATEKLPNSGSAAQMVKTLENAPGVREQEIEETGLRTYLQSHVGTRVSKADVIEYLEERGIQVDKTPLAPSDVQVASGPVQESFELRLAAPVKSSVTGVVEPQAMATVQATTRIDNAGHAVFHIEGIQGGQAPQVTPQVTPQVAATPPFKSGWVELTTRRLMRWAADNGYSRISWSNPEIAATFNVGGGDPNVVTPEARAGIQEFYGKTLPSRMKALAKQYGGVYGETSFSRALPAESIRIGHVTIPEAVKSVIQQGLPLYNRDVGQRSGPNAEVVVRSDTVATNFRAAANRIARNFNEYARKFKLDGRVGVNIVTGPQVIGGQYFSGTGNYGLAWNRGNGQYEIYLWPDGFQDNIAAFYSTMMHEFGHVVMWEHFDALPANEKLMIEEQWKDWARESIRRGTIDPALNRRRAAPRRAIDNMNPAARISQLSPSQQEYLLSFEEWFADQVARWATTREEPLTVVEKSLAGIGRAVRHFLEWMARRLGVDPRPTLLMQNWLDSFMQSNFQPMGQTEYAKLNMVTQKQAQGLMAPNVPAAPRQAATVPITNAINKAFGRAPTQPQPAAQAPRAAPPMPPTPPPPPAVTAPVPPSNPPASARQAAAHADKINWFYKWFAGLLELRDANPNMVPLQRYVEKAREMHREIMRVIDASLTITKRWRGLGRQSENLTHFLDELTNMSYLTADERARGVARLPTPQEIQALKQRVGLNDLGLGVANDVRRFLGQFLDIISQNAINEARVKLAGQPVLMMQKIAEIQGQVANLKSRPFFPFMRFGRHYVTVRDAAGNVIDFTTFESTGAFKVNRAERKQNKHAEAMRKQHGAQNVEVGILPEEVEPFIGLPSVLLEAIETKLNLTPQQLEALQQLRLQLSPSMSFKHHFQNKRYVPGYSQDFMRAFSRYAFFGARYHGHTKYLDGMRQDIRDARKVGGNKAHKIADYMSDHLQHTILDVQGDYGLLKGVAFFWQLGYVPAAATQNMSQTPMVTFPFLASKFGFLGLGEARAAKAIVRAMTQLQNFYKRGSYKNMTEFEMRAIQFGIQWGTITESQAAELAALANGGNLLHSAGYSVGSRAANTFYEKSATMFELAEQWNRRIAYRASLELAMAHTNAKIVDEAVAANLDRYNELVRAHGMTAQQARAIVTANHVTEQTQFVYARYGRPRFMRGRTAGTIFIFKRYMQGLTLLGLNNPGFMMRYLFIVMLLGGMGGLPGYEDLKGMIEGVAKRLGFNLNWEKEVRKFIIDNTNGSVPPDLVLHGMARRGFGVPAALDMMGSLVTGEPGRGVAPIPGQNVPAPVFDRSKAISIGPYLPFDAGKVLDPARDRDKTIAEQAQKASGAAFGMAFNLYKFLTDNQLSMSDPKRWERAIPRQMANVSKLMRTYHEGRERYGKPEGGSTIVNYDVRDTEQFMEVIGLGLGYNNLRTSGRWDQITAQNEHVKYLQFRRNSILGQYHEAIKGGVDQEIDEVREAVIKFNEDVRGTEDRGMVITADTIKRSLQARERVLRARESGVPVQKTQIPIAREYERLFPESTIDVRRR